MADVEASVEFEIDVDKRSLDKIEGSLSDAISGGAKDADVGGVISDDVRTEARALRSTLSKALSSIDLSGPANSIKTLRKRLGSLKNVNPQVSPTLNKGALRTASRALGKLGAVVSVRVAVKVARAPLKGAAKLIDKTFLSLAKRISQRFTTVIADSIIAGGFQRVTSFLGDGFRNAITTADIPGELAAKFALGGPEAARAAKLAGELYVDGFGESLNEVSDLIGGLSGALDIAELSPANVKGLVALRDKFEIDTEDFQEQIRTLTGEGLTENEAIGTIGQAYTQLGRTATEQILTMEELEHQLGLVGVALDPEAGVAALDALGAAADDSFGNKLQGTLRTVQEGFANFAAPFLPVLVDVGNRIQEVFVNNADAIADFGAKIAGYFSPENIDAFLTKAKEIFATIKTEATAVKDRLAEAFSEFDLSGLGESLSTFFSDLSFSDAFSGIDAGGETSGAIQNIADAIGNVIEKVAEYTTSGQLDKDLKKLSDFINNVLIPAIEGISKVAGPAFKALAGDPGRLAKTTLALKGAQLAILAGSGAHKLYKKSSDIYRKTLTAERKENLKARGAQLKTTAARAKDIVVQGVQKGATVAKNIVTKIATGIQAAFNAVMALNPAILVVAAIVALVAILVIAYKKSDRFRAIVDKLFDAFKKGLGVIKDVIQNGFEKFKAGLERIQEALTPVVDFLRNVFTSAIDGIKTAISAVADFITGTLLPAFDTMIAALTTVGEFLSDTLSAAFDAAQTYISNLVDVALIPLELGLKAVKEVAEILGTFFNDTLVPIFDTVKDAIEAGIMTGLDNLQANLNRVKDVAIEVFDFFVRGLEGMRDTASLVIDAVIGFFNDLRQKVAEVVDAVLGKIGDIISKVNEFKTNVEDAIKGAITDAFNNLRDTVDDVVSKATGYVQDFIDKLLSLKNKGQRYIKTLIDKFGGITKPIQDAIDKVGELIRKLKDIPGAGALGKIGGFAGIGGAADGGIFTSAQITAIAEGNRPEVVVPLTKPRRALELLRATGLDDLLFKTDSPRSSSTQTPGTAGSIKSNTTNNVTNNITINTRPGQDSENIGRSLVDELGGLG